MAGAGAHDMQGKAESTALVESCKEKAERKDLCFYTSQQAKENTKLESFELDTDGTRDSKHKFQMWRHSLKNENLFLMRVAKHRNRGPEGQ